MCGPTSRAAAPLGSSRSGSESFAYWRRSRGFSSGGLRDALAAEGLAFDASTVQRFLKRHGLERERRLDRLRRKRWTER